MRKIKSYGDFHNEEINIKKALAAGGIVGALALGGAAVKHSIDIHDNAELVDTETISGTKFDQFQVGAMGETFDLNISLDGVICAKWSARSGKHTHTYNTVTVPPGTKAIWRESDLDMNNGIFVSARPLKDGEKIDISELDVYEKGSTYTIYKTPFLESIDYIVVLNGHTEGEEIKIEGKIGKYKCDRLARKVYAFYPISIGGGTFGGGGSGTDGKW